MAHAQRHTHSEDIEEQQQDSNSTNMAHAQRHTHSGDIEEQQQDSLNSTNMAHAQRQLTLETLKNNSKTL